ncbi:cyanophycin synthetase [Xylophilus rhododendri]|uniref:Cyanophycin synthetase n=1 Tax=Xylophilus rhododendri TaxID=2697032 RepID=A0A857J471_9BURK|nr:cyanophycin synthetase [Xylophilus rhododendri]QHI97851.1 cyanophycin synthetase [Xylophilus rhododendri]
MATKNDIRILDVRYLHGSNIWTYREVLEVRLDLGELEQFPSNTLPGLNQRLATWLPALIEHTCSPGERGGFLQRLEGGTWMGHVLEHVIIELLNLSGMPTTFGQTRETTVSGIYKMVFRAPDEAVARVALAQGHALLMAAINDKPFDVPAAVAAVRTQIDRSFLGPSTDCIVTAAADRKIPHIRLNAGNLVQLGYGKRQRRIWTAETDRTSAIAEGIAQDKDLTKMLLTACGVPVPEGQVVTSAAEAWDIAQDIGLPVVVKPSDGNHARGVTLDLRAQADIEAAFHLAEAEGSGVIVERFIEGTEHRLLVVGGKVFAATRGEPVWVTGDGAANVEQLIALQMNSDPRRGVEHQFPLTTIDVHKDGGVQLELRRQQLTAASVPAAGERVLIQRTGNMAIDCTDEVHPDVAHAAALAARAVGLDIAGIDMVTRDVSRPLSATRGAIVEVNAGPGLLMHLKPIHGKPRPVGRAICDHLFAADDGGRIPLVGVAGTRHTAAISRLVAWIAHLDGKSTGVACRDGLFLDRRCHDAADSTHWQAGERLLINRNVEVAVIENPAATILRDGLAYDRCQIGIVTDFDGIEALAEFDVHTPEHMRKALRTQVDVVLPGGCAVLNAADAHVAELAPLCDGEVIFYAADPATPALVAHCAAGGRGVTMRNGRVAMVVNSQDVPLSGLGALDGWRKRHGELPDEAMLAAVAAGWALGVHPRLIGAGLEAFECEAGVALVHSAAEEFAEAA